MDCDNDDGDLKCWTYLANILDDESSSSDDFSTFSQCTDPAQSVRDDGSLTKASNSQLQPSCGLHTSEEVGQALPVSSDLATWFEDSWSGSEASTTASKAAQKSGRFSRPTPSSNNNV
jgi:hypothetical protein